ncbi:IS1096 element passenger TnpR family protein [Cupriavidus sp. TA19]|uniref:IS1096 element passenger TnpR family protein n=1 Tax=Cupriavidus sp. TA19 TaxID=701108 RepID=UPI00398BDFAC
MAPDPGPAISVLQLRIALRGLSPPVWRRVLVPEHLTLGRLHHVIQVVMSPRHATARSGRKVEMGCGIYRIARPYFFAVLVEGDPFAQRNMEHRAEYRQGIGR